MNNCLFSTLNGMNQELYMHLLVIQLFFNYLNNMKLSIILVHIADHFKQKL